MPPVEVGRRRPIEKSRRSSNGPDAQRERRSSVGARRETAVARLQNSRQVGTDGADRAAERALSAAESARRNNAIRAPKARRRRWSTAMPGVGIRAVGSRPKPTNGGIGRRHGGYTRCGWRRLGENKSSWCPTSPSTDGGGNAISSRPSGAGCSVKAVVNEARRREEAGREPNSARFTPSRTRRRCQDVSQCAHEDDLHPQLRRRRVSGFARGGSRSGHRHRSRPTRGGASALRRHDCRTATSRPRGHHSEAVADPRRFCQVPG